MYTWPMPSPAPSTKAKVANVNEHTWKRRAFHLCAALVIPVVAIGLGYKAAVYTAAIAAAVLASVEALRLAVPAVNVRAVAWLGPLLKPREKRTPTAATYLALASLAVLLLFGIPVATLALAYTALGDPAAGIVGTRYGRLRVRAFGRRLGGKSVEGTLAFLGVSTAAATGLWAAGVYGTLWPALVGAAAAALVEFLPVPLEDNVTVPLASAAVMWLLWVG